MLTPRTKLTLNSVVGRRRPSPSNTPTPPRPSARTGTTECDRHGRRSCPEREPLQPLGIAVLRMAHSVHGCSARTDSSIRTPGCRASPSGSGPIYTILSISCPPRWTAPSMSAAGAVTIALFFGPVRSSHVRPRSACTRLPNWTPSRAGAVQNPSPKRHVYLTHLQVVQLASASGSHATLIRVLAYTGLRWGEVSGLRVSDVDLERRRLSVNVNAVLVGGRVVAGTPKTHKRRVVPFPAFLTGSLAELCSNREDSAVLFPDKFGNHLTTPTVRENSWFDRALDAAELKPMTIHDLRHTAASLAVSSGANVKQPTACSGTPLRR
jgi:hypothetical protein